MDAAAKLANAFVKDDMITIELEDGGSFTVQKALLSIASDYFDRAVNGRFMESSTKTLKLKEWTTESFQLFLHWICRRSLPDFFSELDKLPSDTPEQDTSGDAVRDAATIQLIQLWVNADMCLMPALQNAAMEELLKVLSISTAAISTIRLVYEKTSSDSPMRALFLNEFAYCHLVLGHNSFGGPYYSPEDLEEIASIPGLFAEFMTCLKGNQAYQAEKLWLKSSGGQIDSETSDYMIPTGEEMDTSADGEEE